MQRLVNYRWPGNIRELQNVIERAVILSSSSVLVLDAEFQLASKPEAPGPIALQNPDPIVEWRKLVVGRPSQAPHPVRARPD